MFKDLDVKKYIMVAFLSFATVTGLNILINSIYPSIPILKTSFAFIFLLISIVISLLITVSHDGKLDREDIISVLIVLAIMVGLFFVVKNYVPQIFSVIPGGLKETFSFVP